MENHRRERQDLCVDQDTLTSGSRKISPCFPLHKSTAAACVCVYRIGYIRHTHCTSPVLVCLSCVHVFMCLCSSGRGQIRVADRYPTCSPTANSIHDCIWVPEKRTSCPGDLFAQINCTCTIDTPTAATTTASDGPFGDVTSSFTVLSSMLYY